MRGSLFFWKAKERVLTGANKKPPLRWAPISCNTGSRRVFHPLAYISISVFVPCPFCPQSIRTARKVRYGAEHHRCQPPTEPVMIRLPEMPLLQEPHFRVCTTPVERTHRCAQIFFWPKCVLCVCVREVGASQNARNV